MNWNFCPCCGHALRAAPQYPQGNLYPYYQPIYPNPWFYISSGGTAYADNSTQGTMWTMSETPDELTLTGTIGEGE
jgi:hypothetical protein